MKIVDLVELHRGNLIEDDQINLATPDKYMVHHIFNEDGAIIVTTVKYAKIRQGGQVIKTDLIMGNNISVQ